MRRAAIGVGTVAALVVGAACTSTTAASTAGTTAVTSAAGSDTAASGPGGASSAPPPVTSVVTTTVTAPASGTAPSVTSPPTTSPPTTDTLGPATRPGIEIPPGQIEAAIGKLDGLAEAMMKKSGVPGMAVAVVYKGKVVYARGFGVRKVGEAAKVDADTVFQLASVSKPIGATVIAHEVGAGVVAWDTPIKTHLPSFQVGDTFITDRTTIGDVYAHRSGLPSHAGDLLEELGYSQTQVLDRLRYLPLKPFRTSYNYTNFGLTAGGESVAAAAGKDWATLSSDVLYKPLGMTSTSSRFSDYASRTDRAVTHVKVNGTWVAKYVLNPDRQSPAGGVSSSVNDLAKWMMMVLNNGTGANGAKITTPDALLPAITPQIISSPAGTPESRPGTYGFGFDVTTQSSGRTQISHSGAFGAGAGTNFVLMPLADVGIVTLTNGSPVGAAEALNQEFGDLVAYGRATFDWWGLYSNALSGLLAPFGKYAGKARPVSPAPAGPPSTYTGTYKNDYVGDAMVTAKGSSLTLILGPKKMTFPMTHWDKDVFTYVPTGDSANAGSISAITFLRGADGKASKMLIEWYQQDKQEKAGTFTR